MRRVVALRFAYLLALVVWLGGLVTLGAVVAPSLAGALWDRLPPGNEAVGGVAFGVILAQFYAVAGACGVLMLVTLVGMALLGPRPRPYGARVAAIGLMLLATGIAGSPFTRPLAASLREGAGSVAALLSVTVIGGVCLLFWEARERYR